MIIRFGLELDDQTYPLEGSGIPAVHYYCGERGLLLLLEKQTGLSYPNADEYIRIEQYRQLLVAYLQRCPDAAFYRASLEADALATAAALLQRRDELYLAGWDFAPLPHTPVRLRVFADMEQLLQPGAVVRLSVGKPERWRMVIQRLDAAALPFETIYLNEPLDILPPYLVQLFHRLQQYGVNIHETPDKVRAGNTCLGQWQAALLKQPLPSVDASGDHSIVILRAERETALAAYLAKLALANPHVFCPLCLLPNQNRALDNAFIQEGIPSLGILSASLARPTLQILKLVSAFLCDPINPYKILEFLSLPNSPLHDELARKIAETIAEKPGLYSNVLAARVHDFFDQFEHQIAQEKSKKRRRELQQELKETQDTYQFLFKRNRYDSRLPIPTAEIASIFRFLHFWSLRRVEDLHKEIAELDKKIADKAGRQAYKEELPKWRKRKEELQNIQKPLLALHQQANRVWLIVEALPERDAKLTFLQLERLIRTVSEATPIRFRQPEQGHLPYVYAPSAITQAADTILWWNFNQTNTAPLFPRWYASEVAYLHALDIALDSPDLENKRRLWQHKQPILKAQKRIILVLPAALDGREALPHFLWSDLQALFKEHTIAQWTIEVDKPHSPPPAWWSVLYAPPPLALIPSQSLEQPPLETEIPQLEALLQREEESFSSLETLLYCPHRWVFQYLMKLRHSSILNVVGLDALKGNLAHSTFQWMFEELKDKNSTHWKNRADIEIMIEAKATELMRHEGVVLMMYGKEPERVSFINKMKTAAWALISMIQSNGWNVAHTEHPVEGKLGHITLKGIADLVLERNNGSQKAILDLKWGNYARRREDIKNNHDLQLVIYSHLLHQGSPWADTAFFVIENAKTIARNRRAFREAHPEQLVENTAVLYQSIWDKIKATYDWRIEQLRKGKIEIRTEDNYEKVEEHNQFELGERALDLLEMRKDKVRYDKYKPLISKLK